MSDPSASLKQFCRHEYERIKKEDEQKPVLKRAFEAQKTARDTIRALLERNGTDCMYAGTDENGEKAYVRLTTYMKHLSLKEEHVKRAVAQLSDSELSSRDPQVLVAALYKAIQAERAVSRTKVVVGKTRSCTFAGGDTPDPLAARAMQRYTAATNDLKQRRANYRASVKELQQKSREAEPTVLKYLQDENLKSQHIALTHEDKTCSVYLKQRTYRTKPFLTALELKRLISLAQRSMAERRLTGDAARKTLAENLWKRVKERPPVRSEKVTLERAPTRAT